MKVAIDISGVKKDNFEKHSVRGSGEYIEGLRKYLPAFDKENSYLFINPGEKIPQDVDLIHYPYFDPFFLSLPVFTKTPSVVTIHDLIPLIFPSEFPSGLKGAFKWNIQKISLKNRKIITDSNSSKKDIESIAGVSPSRIDVVYLSSSDEYKKLDDEKLKNDMKIKHGLPDKFMLYVGDVTWNKNLLRIAKAIKETDIPIVMVGKALTDGDLDTTNKWNEELAKFTIETEGDARFKKLGYISTFDLNILYNIASALLMPSLYEGFGLPVVEAMKAGCPVICSNRGSLEEVAGDAAFFVDPESVTSISNGIRNILNDQDLAKDLSEKGLKNASRFSWRETIRNTTEAYNKAVVE